MHTLIRYIIYVGILFWTSCSSKQNTITAALYHNTTARYNSFFYAQESVNKVEETLRGTLVDDPTQILQLFPRIDSTKAKSYEADTEEIIKMASLSIQRHPNSKWANNSYLLVGIARLYAYDFLNAKLTFKYVNTNSKDNDLRHRALLWLVRTFTEEGDYPKALEAIQFTEKEKLNKENKKQLFLEKAHYYQVRGDYDNMVYNLSQADPLLTHQDHPGRIYYILGQTYQKMGFLSEAFLYYQKVLKSNPDYNIDFYARLNIAQVAELSDQEEVRKIRKRFEKMLKDSKNEEFTDKIYYELGWFEQKQGNLEDAMDNYQTAAMIRKNPQVQAVSYLRMGQIQFDSLKDYTMAQPYYDSAMTILPKEYENYPLIKERHEILDDFVKYSSTITMNDSLIALSELDTALVREQLTATINARKPVETTSKKKKKRSGVARATNQNQFNTNFLSSNSSSTNSWYYDNLAAVGMGQSEFRRIWGNIPLEDNWRRSTRSTALSSDKSVTPSEEQIDTAQETPEEVPTEINEVDALMAKIPTSDADKNTLLKEIEEAYFHLGDLYFFNLNERENAVASLEKLRERFPTSELIPETLFKLYRIFVNKDIDRANVYKSELIEKYPKSPFARSLVNPDYWKEDLLAAEQQRQFYRAAYNLYQANDLRGAAEQIKEGLKIGETEFLPQLELLDILITARVERTEVYQNELKGWINKYPEEELNAYAKKLLENSQSLSEKLKKSSPVQFIENINEPHLFVSVHTESDNLTFEISNALEKFNSNYWKDLKLSASNLGIAQNKIMTMITELPNGTAAIEYYDLFLIQLSRSIPFSNHKIYNFVITKSNFQLLYQSKALDEYLTFFDHTYQKN